MKAVFTHFADEVAAQFAMGSVRSEGHEFVSVVSGESASAHGYPKKSVTVRIEVVNVVAGQPPVHGDVQGVVAVGKRLVLLCGNRSCCQDEDEQYKVSEWGYADSHRVSFYWLTEQR